MFTLKAILATVLISVVINGMLYFFQDERKVTNKLQLFHEGKDEFTALAVGTSHSIGFHFPSLGQKGINFYDGGGDIEEVVFKSGIIMDQAVNIGSIFVSVSPGTLHMSQNYGNNINRQLVVIKNLPLSYDVLLSTPSIVLPSLLEFLFPILEVKNEIKEKIDLSLASSKNLNGFSTDINRACLKPILTEVDKDALILGGYKLVTLLPNCLDSYAANTVTSHSSHIESTILSDVNMPSINVSRLSGMADEFKLRKVETRLILVVPPLTVEYYEDERIQKWISEHNKLLAELSKHPNIDVYDFHDFFHDEMADGSNDFFYDDDHLALPGAIKFSKALKQAMDEREGR
ncbi:hypothetical protein Swoo_1674 [Shewanella woodyi ATCC 51908]|uniref:AlgX/AlgJ SGNH hydrolase-like domain-containing protein n=2 Tax=Shewanella woodyi TaxID=60961 RepID=B1KMG1_SHEWM|nr:hypothetical protein Swoo_1674 [Shewanella woodyi ATCC 51908]